MPAPNPAWGDMVTTTLESRSKVLADNMSKNNALLYKLQKRGTMKPVSGGRTIAQELNYAENGTFKRYSGYEALDIGVSEVFTAAEFSWAQAAVAVTLSGLEQLQNNGSEQMIDLLEARISNAEQTMQNNIALDCYSDGTADGGKQIGGLNSLVPVVPTAGTVGGINRATASNAFWRSRVTSRAAVAGANTNITLAMNKQYVALVRGTDHPDLIIADEVFYTDYMAQLQQYQRFASSEMAEAGFTSIKFMNADVVLDGGVGGGCPASTMFFLNTKYIHYRPHKDRNFVPIGGKRESTNQDASVRLLGWAGNMTLSNAQLQGRLTA
jgi:hypothetical protein